MTDTQTHTATRTVLNVEQCAYEKTASLAFVGAAAVSLRYLGETFTSDYLMGVSGGAFKMYWTPPWALWNCDLLIIGEEPVRRTFDAMGYDYAYIPDYVRPHVHAKEFYRSKIMDSLNRGVPVLAIGVVGPPEVCVVSGYDQDGAVLQGWSYFQDDQSGPYRQADWYDAIYGLILIGAKKQTPAPLQVLHDTLEWAVQLTRVPRLALDAPGPGGVMYTFSGLASYDAMAEALLRDEDFPADNLDLITEHANAASNDGPWLMFDNRRAAAAFLQQMIETTQPHASTPHLWKAAEQYARESAVWHQAAELAPWTGAPPAERLKWADPARRREIAQLVREAKAIDERAVGHLETALNAW